MMRLSDIRTGQFDAFRNVSEVVHMYMQRLKKILPTPPVFPLVLAAVLALAGCSLAPEYHRPDLPVPDALSENGYGNAPAFSKTGSAAMVSSLGWSDFFHDAQLRETINAALLHNKDLMAATLAVQAAQAQYRVQRADRVPQLSLDGGDKVSGSFITQGKDGFTAQVGMPAFELDFFGRVKNMSESARQKYLASSEAQKTVHIALVAQTAQSWLAERLADERLQLAMKTQESWQNSYAFMAQRFSSGQASALDLEQSRSMAESARATVAQFQRDLTQATNGLRLLTGDFAFKTTATASSLASQSLAELPSGVASSTLLARPDIMEAEHNLKAANADIGVARAAFFPSISLTADLGYASNDLLTLFDGTTSGWSFLPRLTLPLFTAGRNKANLTLAEVNKQISVVQYEKAIQTAFRETADALMTRAAFARQLEAQNRYVESQRTVLNLATRRYISGSVSYLEVLDAQRNVFQAEQDLLVIRQSQLANDINLYSALGGGLEKTTPGQPAQQQLTK